MKSITLLLIALSTAYCAFPMSLLARQTTLAPSATVPPSGNSVMASTCKCFQSTQDQLTCLDANHQYQQFMNGWFCSCYDESIILNPSCPFPTGSSNASNEYVCDRSWWLQYFDIFCFDSFSVSSYSAIDGRIAAMNDIWLSNYRVAYMPKGHEGKEEETTAAPTSGDIIDTPCSANMEDWRYSVVAGRSLMLNKGKIYSGDVIYGSQYNATADSTLSQACQYVKNASVLDWQFARSEIVRISNGLMQLPANGMVSVSGGVLTFSGPAQWRANDLLVFKILLTDLLTVRSVKFTNIPAASQLKAIIFNFDTNGVQLPSSFSFDVPSVLDMSSLPDEYENKLVFNFGQISMALSLSSSSVSTYRDVYGILLAPEVSLMANDSKIRVYGQAFLKSFSGSNLISEHLNFDFCLADLISSASTATPMATTQAPTQPATTQAATTSIPVTTQVPSVIGTTKIPATTTRAPTIAA